MTHGSARRARFRSRVTWSGILDELFAAAKQAAAEGRLIHTVGSARALEPKSERRPLADPQAP